MFVNLFFTELFLVHVNHCILNKNFVNIITTYDLWTLYQIDDFLNEFFSLQYFRQENEKHKVFVSLGLKIYFILHFLNRLKNFQTFS